MNDTTPGALLEADEGTADDAPTESADTENTADAAAPEPDSADEPGPAQSPRTTIVVRLRPYAFRAALIVLLLAATVSAVVFGWKLHDRDQADAAARDAMSTAQTYAVTLTSIDSQHIDQNLTDVLNGATGDFKDMYSQSSTQLKSLLVQNNAVSKGRVVDVSIKSASQNQVVVMLFVDQEVTNSTSPDPRIDRSRILMTMQRVGSKWLAGKVEML